MSPSHAAHHPAVEQQLRLVLALLPRRMAPGPRRIPARDPAALRPARAKKGLRRSTLTVGLQRILRSKARV